MARPKTPTTDLRPSFVALERLLEEKLPQAKGRVWARLQELELFTISTTNNWRVRGVPDRLSQRQKLANLMGITLEELNRSVGVDRESSEKSATTPEDDGAATGVTQSNWGLRTGQIWRLPYIQEDQLQYLMLDNEDPYVVKLDRKAVRSLEDINEGTDKAVELFIETPLTPQMSKGDILVMRAPPKDGSLPLRHLPVVVVAPSGDLFMIEFDNEKINSGGLVVIAYTVDWIPKRPPVRAVYQIK